MTRHEADPLPAWQIAARGTVVCVALALSLIQATLVLGLLSHVAPPGFVPADASQYVKYAISGAPVLGLYLWSVSLGLAALRDPARPARWAGSTVVAGMVASAAWLWSMLGLLA